MINRNPSRISRLAVMSCSALLVTSACASDGAESQTSDTTEAATTSDTIAATDSSAEESTETNEAAEPAADADSGTADAASSCEDIAAQFTTRGSANADLDDPESSAVCDGDNVLVSSNGIPDYTYIETSPGSPTNSNLSFSFPASPTVADAVTAVPLLGTAAVTLSGIPIFGPTEGTGGDVGSIAGIVSDCGSHNGPTGFHTHLILTSSETDCLFSPEEVAAGPQLVGYAFDGFPIYTGIGQYESSWELTDESLFATDTWSAHTYIEGSGDLDECNGLTDADGNYAYYTTEVFPYVLGCYSGIVELDAAGDGGGEGGGGEGGGEGGGGGDRPEPPAGEGE